MNKVFFLSIVIGLLALAPGAHAMGLAPAYEKEEAQEELADDEIRVEIEINGKTHVLEEVKTRGVGIPVTSALGGLAYDLYVGVEDPAVLVLQNFLNNNGFVVAETGAGSPGNVTSYFGSKTQAALAKFQAAYGISPTRGYFGARTKAVVGAQ